MFTNFGEFLPLLEEDSGLEVGTGAEETELAEPLEAEETGAEVLESAEPTAEEEDDEEPDTGRTDADSAFAQLRREKEEAERKAEQLEDALGLFFDGDDKPLKAKAYAEERPLEEVKAEFEANEERERLARENEELKEKFAEKEAETLMERDLREIQKIDPTVTSLDELGQDFFDLVSTGRVTGVQAFYAVRSRHEAEQVKTPELPGKANQSPEEKDYFTREEVDNMSKADIHKNYEAIRKSMQKW